MARRPFYGQGGAIPIAKMNMQAATAPGRAYAQMGKDFGDKIGGAIETFGENKKKGEAAEMQIGAILESMSDERKAELTSGENPIGKTLDKFIQGELSNSKKEALLGSLSTIDARDRMDRQEEMVSKFNQLRMDQLEQANQQQENQRVGQGQFSSLMAKGMANESDPTQFMEMVGQARSDGLLNNYGTSLATNHFFNLKGAENEALKQQSEFKNKVNLEVVKAGLKNQPQQVEEAYKPGPDIMANNINRSYEIMDTDGFIPSTGFGGLLKAVPGTDAHRLGNLLQTIKGNIGFDYLQAMREASPTGGALGQVSNQELSTLQSVFGSLEQTQGEADLKYNLQLLNHVYNNIVHGEGGHNVPHPDGSVQSAGNKQGQPSQVLLDEEARLQAMLKEREMSQQFFNTPPVQQFEGK